MKKWWQSYQSKPVREERNPSITKDPVTLLDERLQFFAPRFNKTFSIPEAMLYLISWSLFITILEINHTISLSSFFGLYTTNLAMSTLTVVPIVIVVNMRRNTLKHMDILTASIQIIISAVFIGVVAFISTFLAADALGIIEVNLYYLFIEALFQAISVAGFCIVFLLYYLRSYRDLTALRTSFERRLEEQNDHIKARIAPHFFFNTINTLVSLVETEPEKASNLLQHVSHLFRASFSEPKEGSFEDELELCEHYLAIEKYRLNTKLEVSWSLPDEDMLYDMTITSMTLQSVLEQTILHIVEMTLDTVFVDIKVTWENHTVIIIVQAKVPKQTLMVSYDIKKRINFRVQEERLKSNFGKTSRIHSIVEEHLYTNIITYPLYDAI